MIRTKAKVILFLLMSTGGAYSQGEANPPRSQGELVNLAFNRPLTSQNPIELARLFDGYCREVLNNVPTNTPAEDAWVKTELAGPVDNLARMSRLIASTEWARHQLKQTFTDCVRKIDLLRRAQAQNALAAEAAHFVDLAMTFNSDADINTFAKRANMALDLSMGSLLRQFLMLAAIRALDNREPTK